MLVYIAGILNNWLISHTREIPSLLERNISHTPGMRELGNIVVETGIEETFFEIIALSEKCQFNNCTHIEEKGCAVLAAVDNDLLSIDRYHNYMKMNKESTYNEMSYLDKRKKDKQFAKLCKSVMKHKKSQR